MRTAKSIKNILYGLGGQLLTLITTFAVRTVFVKILGETYLGINGLFTNVLSMLSIAELGVGSAIVYSLYKPIAENDEHKIKALMNLYAKAYKIIGVIVFLLGTSLLPVLKYIIKSDIQIANLNLIYMLFVVNSASSYFFIYRRSLIIANQKNYIVTSIGYGFTLATSALQVSILVFTKNYIAFLMVQILLNIIQNAFVSIIAAKRFPYIKDAKNAKLEKKEKVLIFNNIRALVIYKVGGVLVSGTDNIIISSFVGVNWVGIYSNYNLIIGAINNILSIIFSSLTASVGNLNAVENGEKKYFIYKVITFANFWFFGFCSVCLWVLINPFVNLWLGKNYILEMGIVFIIIFNFYINGMMNATWMYRETMGLFVYGRYRPLASAAINLIFSIILVQYYGIAGVFWGTAITRLSTNVWFDPYIIHKHGFGKPLFPYYLRYFKYTLATAFAAEITSFICSALFYKIALLPFAGRILFCLVIPNIIFLLAFYKTEEFRYFYSLTMNIAKKVKIKQSNNDKAV